MIESASFLSFHIESFCQFILRRFTDAPHIRILKRDELLSFRTHFDGPILIEIEAHAFLDEILAKPAKARRR